MVGFEAVLTASQHQRGQVLGVRSDLPVPEGTVFQSDTCEIAGGPHSSIFKGESSRLSEKMHFPKELSS